MILKDIVRSIVKFLHIDATKGIKYDRLTTAIFKEVLTTNSHCIDIGCHNGDILKEILHYSPHGKHIAFEPLPHLYQALVQAYSNKATIYPYALSNQNGSTTFQYVRNAPAFSGIKKRRYDTTTPNVEEIHVEMRTLDSLVDSSITIDLIKIDVEGAEYGVLLGARELLLRDKPYIIFECGMGGTDYYGTTPEQVFTYLVHTIGLHISLLDSFLQKAPPLTLQQFQHIFTTNSDYYFIAHCSH